MGGLYVDLAVGGESEVKQWLDGTAARGVVHEVREKRLWKIFRRPRS
jgi:hypothetical protein